VFRGKFYTAGIAWLPADEDESAAAAAANGHSESSLNNNNMHSQDSSNSSTSHLQQQASASLPVSDARLASVTAAAGTGQLEGAGGPYVSLSNFQLNGECVGWGVVRVYAAATGAAARSHLLS
jgi:hypothetical protein